ncbi:hypothetical protein Hhel01_01039 [Haloferula helveola]
MRPQPEKESGPSGFPKRAVPISLYLGLNGADSLES